VPIRDSAILRLIVFALMGFTVVFMYWGDESPAKPGWMMMGAAVIAILLLIDLPQLIRSNTTLNMLMRSLDTSLANGDHQRAEELLTVARNRIGEGSSATHRRLDLAQGTIAFREGRYEEALMTLERCFLNSFAINDPLQGEKSGLLLLKTLTAMGRYRDVCDFALGVRELSQSKEIEQLVALASNRMRSY